MAGTSRQVAIYVFVLKKLIVKAGVIQTLTPGRPEVLVPPMVADDQHTYQLIAHDAEQNGIWKTTNETTPYSIRTIANCVGLAQTC